MARLLDSPYAQSEDAFAAACAVVQRRRMMDSPMKRAMVDIAERYNADFTIPLPDVEGEPEFPALSAAIIADAIDSAATRANDTTPGLMSPPIDPTAQNHKDRAHTRRRAWSATWFESQLPLRLARAYRQSFGYGTFCLMAVPDFERKRARIITRDPLLAYAEPMGPDEVRAPKDIGFVYGRSSSFLRKQYPESAALIQKWMRNEDDLWDVLEWIDGDQVMVGILGKRQPESYQRRTNVDGSVNYGIGVDTPMEQALLLRAYPNRAGMVPGCCPASVTLDRAVSSLKRIIPIVDLMNKIAALDFLAAERGVFPDRYVVGDGQGTPKIVGGTWQDGRTGNVNLLEDVKTIGELQTAPGPMTQQLLSMLERNARVSAGNPSVFQGEMSGSVRSGQTINQLGAFAVDPRIKEAHLIMQYALQVANEGVAAIELGYWPARKYVVFSGWAGDNSHVSYVPEDIFTETKQNIVQYPMPGMDVTSATIALAQLNGAKMMSRKTARNKHPLIDDGAVEEQQMMSEALGDAIEMASMQQVQAGTLAFSDLVAVQMKVDEGMTLGQAMVAQHKEAQQRQATEAPPPDQSQGQVASPEAQPGLNDPNAGGQMPPGAPPGPENMVGDQRLAIRSLVGALRGSQGPTADSGPGGGAPVAAAR